MQLRLILRLLVTNKNILSIYQTQASAFNQVNLKPSLTKLIIILKDETNDYQLREITSVIDLFFKKWMSQDPDNTIFRLSDLKEKIQVSEFYKFRYFVGQYLWSHVYGENLFPKINIKTNFKEAIVFGEHKYWHAVVVKELRQRENTYLSFLAQNILELIANYKSDTDFIKKYGDLFEMPQISCASIEKTKWLKLCSSTFGIIPTDETKIPFLVEKGADYFHVEKLSMIFKEELGAKFDRLNIVKTLEYDLEKNILIISLNEMTDWESIIKLTEGHYDGAIFIEFGEAFFQITTKHEYEYYHAFFGKNEFPEISAQLNISSHTLGRYFLKKIDQTCHEIDVAINSRELLKIHNAGFVSFVWKLFQITYFLDTLSDNSPRICFDKEKLRFYLLSKTEDDGIKAFFDLAGASDIPFAIRKQLVSKISLIYNQVKEKHQQPQMSKMNFEEYDFNCSSIAK